MNQEIYSFNLKDAIKSDWRVLQTPLDKRSMDILFECSNIF